MCICGDISEVRRKVCSFEPRSKLVNHWFKTSYKPNRTLNSHSYMQYLNCRWDASPHRELASPHQDLASPHRDLGVPPSRFERWVIRRKRPNFGEKPFQFRRRPFFFFYFGLHLILAKKRLSCRQRPFFWCSFNFGDGIT